MINAFGLGALNIYWIVGGMIFVLLNVTPLSLDCSASMESFFSLPHECTSLEFWLNYMWCFAIAGWSGTCVVLALLPKLVKDCAPRRTHSPSPPSLPRSLAQNDVTKTSLRNHARCCVQIRRPPTRP